MSDLWSRRFQRLMYLSVTGGKYYIATMKKIYHLSSCTTCQRILGETGIGESKVEGGFVMQDIKTRKITPGQLEALRDKAGTYEALFSRRALKYKELGLKDKQLGEADYRRLILEDYTFLKRPVVLLGNAIFAGSEKKTVADLQAALALTPREDFSSDTP
jgi:arsenate reductase (glutaredoxin)